MRAFGFLGLANSGDLDDTVLGIERLTHNGATHLVKAFNESDFPQLAADEFFCMRAAFHCGLEVPEFHLSQHGKCAGDADVWLAPAYDLVTTTVYSSNDIMGLLLGASKAWPKRKMLVRFGPSSCGLTDARCNELFTRVHDGMTCAMEQLSEHRSTHPEFEAVGEKMTAAWMEGLARSIAVQ